MASESDLLSRRLIETLVRFDTTSRSSNLALIHHVRDYLAGFGVESRLIHDATGAKANLYATIGPDDVGGVMLSGHTDVVPVDGQEWATDPFRVETRDGNIYGRGTCDMKSFIAAALAFVPRFAARRLVRPLHLCLSYDEEVGCLGVRGVIAAFEGMAVRPAMCVVGEPTSMRVVVAHKGKRGYRALVRGAEAHSSLAPRAVNAIEYAALLIAHIRALGRRRAAEGPFDADFDVPHTTFHTGVVSGGTALNIVPGRCSFDFELRHLPGEDADALFESVRRYAVETLEPEMKAVAPGAAIAFEPISEFPGLDTDPGEEVVRFVKALAGRNDHAKVAFGTEAGLFQGQGRVPTVVCGPGDIAQAHKPNEFIAVDQVALCEAFMARLLERLTA